MIRPNSPITTLLPLYRSMHVVLCVTFRVSVIPNAEFKAVTFLVPGQTIPSATRTTYDMHGECGVALAFMTYRHARRVPVER